MHSRIVDCWQPHLQLAVRSLSLACRYFEYSHVTPELPFLDPNKNYLFVHFPHGSFPMGSWLSLGATKAKGTACTVLDVSMLNNIACLLLLVHSWLASTHYIYNESISADSLPQLSQAQQITSQNTFS